jgi:hypothetical protein
MEFVFLFFLILFPAGIENVSQSIFFKISVYYLLINSIPHINGQECSTFQFSAKEDPRRIIKEIQRK